MNKKHLRRGIFILAGSVLATLLEIYSYYYLNVFHPVARLFLPVLYVTGIGVILYSLFGKERAKKE